MANAEGKGVKKKWIMIVAPKEFKNVVIGESLGSNVIGRIVEANYGSLIGDMRRQRIKLIFKINELKGNQANTELIGYELSQAYIKRGIRKGRGKIDDSFVCEGKDKIKCVIKPVLITRGKTNRSVRTELRKKAREYLVSICTKKNFTELVLDLTENRIQRELKHLLKKIYPIAVCEIRILKKL